MNRTKGILAAGTLTGLVLITILALGFGNLGTQGDGGDTAVPQAGDPAVSAPVTGGVANEEALQAWQDYSAELEQTVRTMQEREATYQSQLDAANATITQMESDINSANSAPAYYDDDDAHEYEEHEDEDHDEHEEYEAHEEHDDD